MEKTNDVQDNRILQDTIGRILISTIKVDSFYETAVFAGKKLPEKWKDLPGEIDWSEPYPYVPIQYSDNLRAAKRAHNRALKEVRANLKGAMKIYREESRVYASPDC